jgi:hypothetical protein
MLVPIHLFRQDLASLASRVRSLENANSHSLTSASSAWSASTSATKSRPPLRQSFTNTFSEGSSEETSTEPSSTSYRAATAPWQVLVTHAHSTLALQKRQFRDTVHRLTERDQIVDRHRSVIHFDILARFTNLTPEAVLGYVNTYARVAPYPIIHYQSLRNATLRVIEAGEISCYGELVSILIVRIYFLSTLSKERQH